jgi:hypothetical protein
MLSRHARGHIYPDLLTAEESTSALSEMCAISGFHREVDYNCALLGYYAASSGNSLPTFRGNLSVPSPLVKKPKWFRNPWTLNMGPIGIPETSVGSYHYWTCNNPEERSFFLSQIVHISGHIQESRWATEFLFTEEGNTINLTLCCTEFCLSVPSLWLYFSSHHATCLRWNAAIKSVFKISQLKCSFT